MTAGRRSLLVLLAFLPLYLTWTFDHSLWNPDETRDAGIAREMYVEKSFAVPLLDGEPFLEKPPLYYWSCAAVYAVTGRITAGLTRLPAALYGFLGLLFAFLIGRRLFNPRTGLMAATILGTGFQWFNMSHFALMDTSLATLITGALYFHLAEMPILFILFVILAFFAKGFVAVALAGLVVTVDLWMNRRPKAWAALVAGGALIFVACVAPWVYALWKSGGAHHLRVFFIDNNFKRFVSSGADHQQPPYFYIGSILADFLPWTPLLIAAFVAAWTPRGRAERTTGERFLWRWFLAIFIFLSISKSKRSMYLMPAFPAAALLIAAWFDRVLREGPRNAGERVALAATSGLLLTVALTVAAAAAVTHAYWMAAVAAVGAAAAFLSLRRQVSVGNYRRLFVTWGLLAAFAYVGAEVALIRRMEADKTFLPVVAMVNEQWAGGGGTVLGFRLSEMERGVFYFYFEGRIPNLQTESELTDYLRAHASDRVVVLMNRNALEKLSTNPPPTTALVGRYRPGQKARSYLVYSNQRSRPTEPTIVR